VSSKWPKGEGWNGRKPGKGQSPGGESAGTEGKDKVLTASDLKNWKTGRGFRKKNVKKKQATRETVERKRGYPEAIII